MQATQVWRYFDRGTGRSHRLCRTARDQADHRAGAAGGLSAAEFLLEYGDVDMVVERQELRGV